MRKIMDWLRPVSTGMEMEVPNPEMEQALQDRARLIGLRREAMGLPAPYPLDPSRVSVKNVFEAPTREETQQRFDELRDPNRPPQTPAPKRSLVGGVVAILAEARATHRNVMSVTRSEIAAKSEQLRQTEAVLHSLELAMLELQDDPALTDDERALVEAVMDDQTGAALEAVATEGLGDGN